MLRLRNGSRFLFGWLLSALIAFGILWPLLDLIRIGQEWIFALAAVLIFTLFVKLTRRLKPVLRMPLRLAGFILLVLLTARGLFSFVSALMGTPVFQTAAFLHSDTLVLLLSLLTSLFGLLLSSGDAAFGAPLVITAAMMLWMSGARAELTHYLPAALSVPLMFVYSRPYVDAVQPKPVGGARLWRRAVPAGLAAVLLALMLTPAQRTTYAPLEKKADELRQWINDYFFFTDSRQAFSLRGEGWQPMGDEGLGGVPQVPDTPVMEVIAEGKTYLRGSIRDMYNGRGWYDTISKDRYGFNSPRFAALRDELMDAGLPADSAFPLKTAEIHMLRDSTSTLLVPQRLRELIPGAGLVPYFNTASEIFVTRNLKAGDRYTVRYENYVAGDSLRLLARSLEGRVDGRYAKIQAQYSSLPEHLSDAGIVSDLARQYAGSAKTPYDMAENIMLALQKHYQYTLDVPETPRDIDFAAHFLFQSKKGYCTYFATAMVVLARSVGLPARYIEGFLADGGASPEILTSKNAHAWAEVYIPSVGWVVFDATAPQSGQGNNDDKGGGGGKPDTTPEPTATPQPTEGPQQAENSPKPSDRPPEPSPIPSPEPSDGPENTDAPDNKKKPPFPWWLLILLLTALSVWRALAVNPMRIEKKIKDPSKRLLLWWQAFVRAKAAGGRGMEPSETMGAYARRVANGDDELQQLAHTVSAVVYGRKQASPDSVPPMRERWKRALSALPIHRRILYYVKRFMVSGEEARAAFSALWKRVKIVFKF